MNSWFTENFVCWMVSACVCVSQD